jgi:hypothetical protein
MRLLTGRRACWQCSSCSALKRAEANAIQLTRKEAPMQREVAVPYNGRREVTALQLRAVPAQCPRLAVLRGLAVPHDGRSLLLLVTVHSLLIVNVPQFPLHVSFLHFAALQYRFFCGTTQMSAASAICVVITTIQILTSNALMWVLLGTASAN